MNPEPLDWIDQETDRREALGLRRSLTRFGRATPGWIEHDGRLIVNLASNDYLGLANDPRVIAAGKDAADREGWGASASPLVSGWRGSHQELVEALVRFEQTEAVALFPTGYAANLGTIAALVNSNDAVYSDRLNHSCLIQGVRLSGASLRVYPHNDHERLADLIARERHRYRRILIATDGVFSMDGDLAPLRELVEIAERSGAMLLVDEAHGTGVFGPDGRGACSAFGVSDRVTARVGTLSKAIGSVGGFVAGSRRLIDHLVNAAPTFVYSTSMPPAAAAAAREAIRIIEHEPWRRDRVHEYGRNVRDRLQASGVTVAPSTGPIVPVILGDVDRASQAAKLLLEAGFLVPAIRPPTVPRGTARLRIGLSAAHELTDLDRLMDHLIPMCVASLSNQEDSIYRIGLRNEGL